MGGFVFAADLLRALSWEGVALDVEMIWLRSYGDKRVASAISMIAGRQLSSGDAFGIVVGEGLANAFKLRVGDSINLVLNTREGAMNTLDFKVVGIFRSLSKEYDVRAVRIPPGPPPPKGPPKKPCRPPPKPK